MIHHLLTRVVCHTQCSESSPKEFSKDVKRSEKRIGSRGNKKKAEERGTKGKERQDAKEQHPRSCSLMLPNAKREKEKETKRNNRRTLEQCRK